MRPNNHAFIEKCISFCGAIIIISTLSACGGMSGLGRNDPLPPGQGMVVLQISNLDSSMDDNWDMVEIRSISEKITYSVNINRSHEFFTTGHYSRTLPPGLYQIQAFKSTESSSTYTRTITAPMLNKLGSFKIESGHLTDLGTIVYHSLFAGIGKGRFVVFPIGGKETVFSVERLNPVAYASFKDRKVLGWQELKIKPSESLIAQIKNNLPRLNHPYETKDGEIYCGGLLGKIYARNPSGSWKTLDTGTSREIFRVEKSANTLYATSENLLLKSSDNGTTWQTMSLPNQTDSLQFFHIGEDGTQYLYLFSRLALFGSYKLYSRKNDSSDWSLLTKDTYDNQGPHKILPSDYHFSEQPQFQFTPEEINNYTLAKDQKSVSRDIVGLFHSMHYLNDGTIYGVRIGISLSPYKDPSFGFYDPASGEKSTRKEWIDAEVNDLYFINKETGYVSLIFLKKGQSGIYKTNDAGKNWTHLPNSHTAHFVHVARDGTLLSIGYRGNVYSSKNDGNTWTQERKSNIDNMLSPFIVPRK